MDIILEDRAVITLRRLHAENFRSFKDLNVAFNDFDVLVGPNASGKSNLLQCIRLLRDVAMYGIDDAISIQGGADYAMNANVSPSTQMSIEAELDWSGQELPAPIAGLPLVQQKPSERHVTATADRATYRLAVRFSENRTDFQSITEQITLRSQFYEGSWFDEVDKREGSKGKKAPFGSGVVRFSSDNGKLAFQVLPESGSGRSMQDLSLARDPLWMERVVPPAERSLLTYLPLYPGFSLGRAIAGMSVYDFDPKLAKRAASITGRRSLEEDGSNLAIALRNLIAHGSDAKALSGLMADLLPFVSKVDVERFADKSLLLTLRETYGDVRFPAFLLSDGTIHLTALIMALYFEEKSLVAIEEPERNVHPRLIHRIVDLLKEASSRTQVLVTTHSPELVNIAGLESLLFVSRDQHGFSKVTRPRDHEELRIFLDNEIRVGELLTANLLDL